MRNRLIAIGSAIAAFSLIGCGTTCNLAGGFTHPDDEPKIYGGVQRDLDFVEKFRPDSSLVSEHKGDARGLVILIPVAITEGVLTCLGDTLTLPITIYLQERRVAERKRDLDASNSTTPGGP